MNGLKGGGLFVIGLALVILGGLLFLPIIDWLINILAFVLIIIGAVLGIIGLIQVFSGGGDDY